MAESPETVERAFELFCKGLRLSVISERLDVPRSTLSGWKKRHAWDERLESLREQGLLDENREQSLADRVGETVREHMASDLLKLEEMENIVRKGIKERMGTGDYTYTVAELVKIHREKNALRDRLNPPTETPLPRQFVVIVDASGPPRPKPLDADETEFTDGPLLTIELIDNDTET